ncbi:flavodoxin [uncultured Clostridium sp.]|uniref:flavodoxin n=1 Tax=uncultured Clostridium sp. TaxID=59620 RepID=UPI0028F00680|nr:flavodoxin [uncultured Clostridium sp.]
MKNIVVVYWSGTGNTEAMANALVEGARIEEAKVTLLNVSEAKVEDVANADAVALGCPSMGSEVLEEGEMEPFVESISEAVKGKQLALFGSYGWGNGEWMIDWQARMIEYGAELVADGLIINESPDEEGLEQCRNLGESLARN